MKTLMPKKYSIAYLKYLVNKTRILIENGYYSSVDSGYSMNRPKRLLYTGVEINLVTGEFKTYK